MMLDIAGLQHLYGADFTTNSGDTTYTFSETTGEMFVDGVGQGTPGDGAGGDSNRVFLTIWDGDGTDTYDFSNYATDQLIDLAPGRWSLMDSAQAAYLGDGVYARGSVFNALVFQDDERSLIENAVGGEGSDTISGNQAANRLDGHGGADLVIGQGGDDDLRGDDGDDTLYGDFAPLASVGVALGSGYTTLDGTAANNSIATAFDLTSSFSLAHDDDIANSETVRHSTVNATGNGQAGYYRVDLNAGTTLTVDIDHTTNLDSYVRLLRADGSYIVGNDQNGGDPGSTTENDSLFTYEVLQSGSYYIQVGRYSASDAARDFSATILSGALYELNVSVAPTDHSVGDAGNDLIDGGAGADTMAGGAGNDIYYVDNAADTVDESIADSSGNDGIVSSVAWNLADVAHTKGDVEVLQLVGSANINATGNALANILIGNSGANVLDGGAGADAMQGRGGSDVYWVDNANDVVDESALGSSGVDGIVSTVTWSLADAGRTKGDVEVLQLVGSANINATGNALANILVGNGGANILDGGAGADAMQGRGGSDVYWVDNADDIVDESVAGSSGTDGIVSSITWSLSDTVHTRGLVEVLQLVGSANINAYGSSLANTLVGNSGANILDGKAGADTMQGRGGNDVYWVDNANDVVDESAPGSSGNDGVVSTVTWSLADTAHTKGFVEVLQLTGSASINATGNALGNVLVGNSGANVLDGGGGADIMQGRAGNDTYVVDNAGDIVDEAAAGSGTDAIVATLSWSLADTVHTRGTIEVLQLAGATSINATGNAAGNLLVGNSGANVLDGGGGADIMQGRGGNDTYVVDNAGDIVDEAAAGSGTDAIVSSVGWSLSDGIHTKGFVEVLQLVGSANVNAYGNSLANLLVGNSGANLLSGGAGNDILIGGAGADSFLFNIGLSAATNVDTIADFSVADDTIHLDNAVFTALATVGTLAATAFTVGAAAADALDRIIYNSSTGAISYDSDGNGGSAAIAVAQVGTGLALTNADFLVV
jgi:Ca2+-binding RTX toxin-like protein